MTAGGYNHLPAKVVRRGLGLLRAAANRAVAPMENRLIRDIKFIDGSDQPIFVVGAPRSGTTLLYQLMTSALDVAYVSNRHCRWYRAPATMERLKATPFGSRQVFESRFGMTKGPHAPSECGNFWYRFLPRRPHALETTDVDTGRIDALREAVQAFSSTCERPALFKNVILSLRIPVLVEAFPRAMFVVSHRNRNDTAVSILRARERHFGSLDQWFSLRPGDCEVPATNDPFEQVAAQYQGTYIAIDQARRSLPGDRFIDVDYETLCEAPRETLQRIRKELADGGARLEWRDGFEWPEHFEVSRGYEKATLEWQQRIEAAFDGSTTHV